MKQTLNTARVGLFFLLGLAIIWIVYETLSQGTAFRAEGFPVRAPFGDVKTLRVGDDVRVSGVRVGRVSETRLQNGKAEAILEIDSSAQIPADSVATIAISSLLGSNFVSIEAGSSQDFLQSGDEIATRPSPDLNQIFAQLGEIGDRVEGLFDNLEGALAGVSGTPDQPGLVENLNAVLAENREGLAASIENIRQITEKINSGDGTIARLINDNDAYDTLMSAVGEIEKAAQQASSLTAGAGEIVAHIQSGEGTLGSLIYGEELNGELRTIVTNLRELSEKLNSDEGTLGRLLADDSLYRDVQAVIQKAERTIEGLGEQGPITAVGIAANALF